MSYKNSEHFAMTTIILTGQPGSGKTMLARIIQEIGVPMVLSDGEEADSFEDADMKHAATFYPFDFPIDVLRARDAVHPIWGFKFALINNSLAPITINQFRAPRVIIMHRDICQVAAHNKFDLARANEEDGRLLYFARHLECPVLHLSSELLFRNPVNAVQMVETFIGIAAFRETVGQFSMGTEA